MGEILKKLRLLNQKSQKEIAESIDISAPAYFKYENNEAKPTIENLIKLANLYNVSIDYLVGRNYDEEFGYMTDDEKTLVSVYRKLNTYSQGKLLGEATGMLILQK